MGGLEPNNIITDQDVAMKIAIEVVFSSSTHRNYRWHIMQNFRKGVGNLLQDDEKLCNAFNDCVDHSWSEQEFETKWEAMLLDNHLEENEHFQHL